MEASVSLKSFCWPVLFSFCCHWFGCPPEMKHVAALLLLKLGGNDAPDAAAIKAVIEAAGGEADEAAITSLLGDLEGKVRQGHSHTRV